MLRFRSCKSDLPAACTAPHCLEVELACCLLPAASPACCSASRSLKPVHRPPLQQHRVLACGLEGRRAQARVCGSQGCTPGGSAVGCLLRCRPALASCSTLLVVIDWMKHSHLNTCTQHSAFVERHQAGVPLACNFAGQIACQPARGRRRWPLLAAAARLRMRVLPLLILLLPSGYRPPQQAHQQRRCIPDLGVGVLHSRLHA